jgi:UDP-N-acetylglucosamine 2-epimerase (non-hydrolysing)/GDP/UDP-N,N'-diacetylbacillosamine 2-epimerase (hydrolysing)
MQKTTIIIAPNSDAGNKIIFSSINKFASKYPFIKIYQNLSRSNYLGLLQNCGVLVGNSSSGMIEASYFKIPVINIGIRQDGREHGSNVKHVPSNSKFIYQEIQKALKNKNKNLHPKNMVYGVGNASKLIVKILEKTKLNDELLQKQIFY